MVSCNKLKLCSRNAISTVIATPVIDAIGSGYFPTKEIQRLKDGMEKLKHTEAYEGYGVPFAIGVWEKFQGDERMRSL